MNTVGTRDVPDRPAGRGHGSVWRVRPRRLLRAGSRPDAAGPPAGLTRLPRWRRTCKPSDPRFSWGRRPQSSSTSVQPAIRSSGSTPVAIGSGRSNSGRLGHSEPSSPKSARREVLPTDTARATSVSYLAAVDAIGRSKAKLVSSSGKPSPASIASPAALPASASSRRRRPRWPAAAPRSRDSRSGRGGGPC